MSDSVDVILHVDTTVAVPLGQPGTPGQSAYQTWLGLGNTGTEADYLASLKGADGAPGVDGATWRTGSGAPSNGTGVDGDLYLRTDTGDVYKRASGTYSVVANITGPAGSGGSSKSVRHDTSGGYDYTGVATSGTADGASTWVITRIDLASPTTAPTHATGSWTGHTGLTYS